MTPEEMQKVSRKVIVTYGDRKHSGFCIMCGTDLLEPINDFQCCSKCTKIIETCQDNVRTTKARGDKMPHLKGRVCINSGDVMRQVVPLGAPTRK